MSRCAIGGLHSSSSSERILRIRIIVNELSEVGEDFDLQCVRFRFLFLLPRQGGAVFAIEWCLRLLRAIAERDRKCVLPLLGQSFRINVRVPHHQGRYIGFGILPTVSVMSLKPL